MRLPVFAVAALLISAPTDAQQQDTGLAFDVRMVNSTIEAKLASTQTVFVGGVLVSLDPHLAHYFVKLPPLLANSSLLGFGTTTEGVLLLQLPVKPQPMIGLTFYAQGVIAGAAGIEASHLEKITVTDSSVNGPGG